MQKKARKPIINTTLSEETFQQLTELTKITRRKKSSLLEEAIEILWEKYGQNK